MIIPPLKNNCFAMPQGVEWMPVDKALDHIQDGLHPRVEQETHPITSALGRILAHDVFAQRGHPPIANSAVDGF